MRKKSVSRRRKRNAIKVQKGTNAFHELKILENKFLELITNTSLEIRWHELKGAKIRSILISKAPNKLIVNAFLSSHLSLTFKNTSNN